MSVRAFGTILLFIVVVAVVVAFVVAGHSGVTVADPFAATIPPVAADGLIWE